MILIGCTKQKLDHAAPARELYRGRLFTASVAYAESLGCEWRVLSAAHGVVHPDAEIEPYDVTLRTASDAERAAWGSLVATQLRDVREPIVVLAGEMYVRPWAWAVRVPVERPLVGLGVGERFAWLSREVRRAA